MKIIRDVLTGIDGATYDHGRVLGALSILTFLGMGVWVYCAQPHPQPFDPSTYGTGLAAIFAGVGAQLWAKASTEPAP